MSIPKNIASIGCIQVLDALNNLLFLNDTKNSDDQPLHYRDFTCSLNNNHILNNAKVLPCKFLACTNCINSTLAQDFSAVCPCCAEKHHLFSTLSLSNKLDIDLKIMANYQLFTDQLCEKLKQKINELQDLSENCESFVDNHVEFMKDEIIIKTESLKIELEKLCDKLCESLDAEKEKVKERICELNGTLNEAMVDSTVFFDDQNKIKQRRWTPSSTLHENMLNCEKLLNTINESESNIYKALHELKFIASEIKLNEDTIGEIISKDKKPKEKEPKEPTVAPERTVYVPVPDMALTEGNFYCEIDERFNDRRPLFIGRIKHVRHINGDPSWGFIVRHDTNEDIYFTVEDVASGYPEEGYCVIFNVGRNDRGPKAINIKLLVSLFTIRRRRRRH